MCFISLTDLEYNDVNAIQHQRPTTYRVIKITIYLMLLFIIIGVWGHILYFVTVVYPILPQIMEYDSASHKLRLFVGEK